MTRVSCAVFALTFALVSIRPLSAQVQGQWANAGTMQSTRELNVQVRLVSGKVLSIGGVDNNGNLLASAELYSPGSGNWTLTGSMAEAREFFPAVLLTGEKILVSGGLSANGMVLAGAELYDPTTGTWSSAGSLSVPRFGHTATMLQSGKVLVAGGCTASNCSTETAGQPQHRSLLPHCHTAENGEGVGHRRLHRHDHHFLRALRSFQGHVE